MTVAVLAISASCAACKPEPVNEMTLHDFRRMELDKIADECGVSRSTFDLRGDDELHMKPEMNAPYPNVDCALRKINEGNIPFKLGFVGNEAFIGNDQ